MKRSKGMRENSWSSDSPVTFSIILSVIPKRLFKYRYEITFLEKLILLHDLSKIL